ncbi:MAG: tetratricopeptide repeat protein [Xanthobacteraceae bacterium]
MPVPLRAEHIFELAVGALKSRDFERASHLLIEAIKVKPDFPDAFAIRGACLLNQQRPFDALLHFDRALELNPDAADVWNNRGIAFADIGMWESAQECYRRSLALHRAVDPHMMLGGMYAHLMRLEDAAGEFAAALAIEPDLHDAHIKLGVVLLGLGRWREAFPHYEWRWADTPYPPRPYRMFPKWRGEDLSGKTVLLYAEQGYGDEIMSLRFVEPVKGIADRVILETRPTMQRLARTMGVEVIAHGDAFSAGIDYSCPLLDVPMVLGITPETLPATEGYLCAPNAANVQKWRERLARLPRGPNVGLVWSSGRRPLQPETERSAAAKSLHLRQLKPLIEEPRTCSGDAINFISLQMPREPIPPDMRITDWMGEIDDFADTAALVEALDLVITVDTSVAHLAGALGTRVWNLVRFNGYWPWFEPDHQRRVPRSGPGTEDGAAEASPGVKEGLSSVRGLDPGSCPLWSAPGEATPWYRSMRLFRQQNLGDWQPVIESVRDNLVQLARESAASHRRAC